MEDAASKPFLVAARGQRDVKKRFEAFINMFKKFPNEKGQYESEFLYTLLESNRKLDSSNNFMDVCSNFEKALNIFPRNEQMMSHLGKFLFKYQFYSESMQQFQSALRVDPGLVEIEKSLNSVKNLLVDRWHFRMLNDRIRNEAYQQAIMETVAPEDSVLDIGTGTGLLALYASECCPVSVTGCDGSDEMVRLAKSIVHEAGKDEIKIVKGLSYDLSSSDVGGKSSVLITELFDAGLFGEHILETLAHAQKELLFSDARVLPEKAEYFIVGAKCDSINMKYQLGYEAKKLINLPHSNVHVLTKSETYDCEDVHLYPDLKYMTEPQSLMKINFNDVNDVLEKLAFEETLDIKLKAIESGEINVLIGWFNLYLTENVSVTTNPQSETRANAWQQVVFFDFIPLKVEQNPTIQLRFVLKDSKITLIPNPNIPIIHISAETLRFLNDSAFMSLITKYLGAATIYLNQLVDIKDLAILDLCPFPIFGLLMLERGAKSLTCWAKTEKDRDFLKHVMDANQIPEGKLEIITNNDICKEMFTNQAYHAIIYNMLDLAGDINNDVKHIYLKDKLVRGGLLLPNKITLWTQIVSSSWLDINNRVYDKNVSGYQIAKFMNKYQVSQNFHIDISCLEYTALTEAVSLGSFSSVIDNFIAPQVCNVRIERDGVANAILCWYRIEFMEGIRDVATNGSNSYVDSMAFLADPPIPMKKGDVGNIICCVDYHGFKLLMDIDN